jgi:hypothetical protein
MTPREMARHRGPWLALTRRTSPDAALEVGEGRKVFVARSSTVCDGNFGFQEDEVIDGLD